MKGLSKPDDRLGRTASGCPEFSAKSSQMFVQYFLVDCTRYLSTLLKCPSDPPQDILCVQSMNSRVRDQGSMRVRLWWCYDSQLCLHCQAFLPSIDPCHHIHAGTVSDPIRYIFRPLNFLSGDLMLCSVLTTRLRVASPCLQWTETRKTKILGQGNIFDRNNKWAINPNCSHSFIHNEQILWNIYLLHTDEQ